MELTKENVREGLRIINKQNPEWGTWTILRKYDEGIWEKRGRSGDTTLFESEFKFWEVVK